MSDTPLYASRLWPPVRRRAADATASTMDLLESLGYVAKTDATGVFTLLPLGLRVHDRLSRIARTAFEERGANTVAFPTLQSRTLWEQSGRWDVYQSEGALLPSTSRSGEQMCLAPTSEEIAAATVREHLRSHRDLPVRLFLSTSKYRDEIALRGGLMRGREFTMADAYTFDTAPEGMRTSIDFLNDACRAALLGMGLTGVFQAAADGGSISAGPTTEHLVLGDTGQSTILVCDHCGHRGDDVILVARPTPHNDPVVNVIAFALTAHDGSTAPATVAIRSDLQVSPRKLAAATGAARVDLLDPAQLPELFGKEAGTLTPWDGTGTTTLFDTSVAHLDNFAISDGSTGLRRNVAWSGAAGLEALSPIGTDLHRAGQGMGCGHCEDGHYREARAIELAHVFELGTQYTAPMNLSFTDEHGAARTPYMACSGIGITRCLQTLADLQRDKDGLRWKEGTGPADLHIVVLRPDLPAMRDRTDQAVRHLRNRGPALFIDDRPEPAGEKFRYANLLGLPHALVLSPQQDGDEVEFIDRWTSRAHRMPISQIPDALNLR
ncbi:proline--tRNA ligase [Streptomyces sp. AK02-01A]|uniref:proline--tRNA ligase n=1 Tax=Streptomyces sp. AK02-01A TaxID=3028648 RepID=UPI0029AA1F27|nr:aminoacyl--tRNA ligase-related protein [Streptomyces sp. AK02-01A]MDX3854293.1 YbaK/EbsC family protein [Streptomyces sp. AK02-01A]